MALQADPTAANLLLWSFDFTTPGRSATFCPMHAKSKWIYMSAGFLLVALGFVGLFLPLLPTTPLLLLAAACFARSSERWHRWLMQHRLFGPILRNWQANRCIPRRSKQLAVATIVLFGTFTMGFALTHTYTRIIGGILILIGLICVLRIPVCEQNNGS